MDAPVFKKAGCDAYVIAKLLNKSTDLTKRSSFFNEAVIHYWVVGQFRNRAVEDGNSHQDDSQRAIKFLYEKGAYLVSQDGWGFSPLLKAANGSFHDAIPNLNELDILLGRKDYSREDKIEAMELAGARILQNVKNASLFPKAFDYWRKALHLRQIEAHGSGNIEKPQLNLKKLQTAEWVTSAELEDVIEHPDRFVIQSFLVLLRICSLKKWSALNFLLDSANLDDCFRQLWHQGKFAEVFDILWIILETLINHLQENEDAQLKIRQVVKRLVELFTLLDRDYPARFLTEEIIKTSLDLMVSAAECNCHVFCYLIRFVQILSHMPQRLLNKDAMEALSKVRDQRGRNLLHEAIFESDFDVYATVRLLLNAGCDPNANDMDGNAPLHYLAQTDKPFVFSDMSMIAVLLLDFGAQLSRKNVDGKTAVDLLILKNERKRNKNAEQGMIGVKLPNWCTELPRLTCLSARVIRRNRIPYSTLPATLIPMMEKHKIIQ